MIITKEYKAYKQPIHVSIKSNKNIFFLFNEFRIYECVGVGE